MTPSLIKAMWPIDGEHSEWTDEDGVSLTERLTQWIDSRSWQTALPVSEAEAAGLCGVLDDSRPGEASMLVLHSAMAAFVGALGLECASREYLEHALCELVRLGAISAQPVYLAWPGVGLALAYRVHSQFFGVES